MIKSLLDFGAVGDGVTDDTVAIQAAFDSETLLYIPPQEFKVTAPILQRHVMTIFGAGVKSKIVASFSLPHHQVILLQPDAGENWGNCYSNFLIKAPCPSLHIDLTQPGAYQAKMTIEKMEMVNTAGGKSIVLTNPTNVDGFFTSKISNNLFVGGLLFNRLGDSITIDNNTITGPGDGINFTAVPGASHVIIRENNITSEGMAVFAGSYARSVIIENNQIEHTVGSTQYVILCASIASSPVSYPTIRGNNINGHGLVTASLIGMSGCEKGIIDENILSGSPNGIYLSPSANGVRIGKRNINTCTLFLANSGTGTIIE
jgi:trimeric autotransporter adhesin